MVMSNLRIGLSLPTSYLNGDYDQVGELWFNMFDCPKECLAVLRKTGVNSIEVNDLHANPSIAQIEPAIEMIVNNGFSLSLHIFLPQFENQNELPEALKKVVTVLKKRNLVDVGIPLVLHGHNQEQLISKAVMLNKTKSDLATLINKLEMAGIINPVAFELCREKAGGPIGTTYQEVEEIIAGFKDNTLGLCWDMCHTLYNIKYQGWEEPFPSPSFLKKVIHTHIHDLTADDTTHGPIARDNKLLIAFLNLLQRHDYRGGYNLELYPERWDGSFAERRAQVLQSITTLKTLVNS